MERYPEIYLFRNGTHYVRFNGSRTYINVVEFAQLHDEHNWTQIPETRSWLYMERRKFVEQLEVFTHFVDHLLGLVKLGGLPSLVKAMFAILVFFLPVIGGVALFWKEMFGREEDEDEDDNNADVDDKCVKETSKVSQQPPEEKKVVDEKEKPK